MSMHHVLHEDLISRHKLLKRSYETIFWLNQSQSDIPTISVEIHKVIEVGSLIKYCLG